MRITSKLLAVCLALAWILADGLRPPALAQTPTEVVVRAVAKDAKVIGSGVGGARITIRDAATGEILAEGEQQGGTGNTDRIMRTPRDRGATVYGTEDAAAFRATLSLDVPTMVAIQAEAPLDFPHAIQRTEKTLTLVPGKHVRGEGVILELNGFIVEILDPGGETTRRETIEVLARVRMVCGCPTEPGGLWDSDRYTIVARLLDAEGETLVETPLDFAGETSTYEGALPDREGATELVVIAADPERANFGTARTD
ncbi:MAG: hypothetical protein R3199_12280, partial [Gemmatimonadota bacterium]|nr:hypothetical protein [Gemmatimonadota bacterium]